MKLKLEDSYDIQAKFKGKYCVQNNGKGKN